MIGVEGAVSAVLVLFGANGVLSGDLKGLERVEEALLRRWRLLGRSGDMMVGSSIRGSIDLH